MRLIRLVLLASSVLIPSIALTACGGDPAEEPILLDAAVPDAVPPPPDAEPCPDDECDGLCVNFDNAEQTCGDCNTVCGGGEACTGGACDCVDTYVPPAPTFAFSTLTDMIPGAVTGFGLFSPNALVVGYPSAADAVVIGMPYPLVAPSGGVLAPPFVGSGYNFSQQGFSVDAAHFATEGTVTFNSICVNNAGEPTGFTGSAANVVFSPVAGLMDPTIDTSECAAFDPISFSFSYGMPPCPTK